MLPKVQPENTEIGSLKELSIGPLQYLQEQYSIWNIFKNFEKVQIPKLDLDADGYLERFINQVEEMFAKSDNYMDLCNLKLDQKTSMFEAVGSRLLMSQFTRTLRHHENLLKSIEKYAQFEQRKETYFDKWREQSASIELQEYKVFQSW